MTNFLKKKERVTEVASFTESSLDPQSLHQKISACAYELFLKRGEAQGHDLEDWLEAERIVLTEGRPHEKDQPKASGSITGKRRPVK